MKRIPWISIFLVSLKICFSITLPSLYKKSVSLSDHVIQVLNVKTISSCYFECWDRMIGCCAVGFSVGSLYRRKPTFLLECYYLKCFDDKKPAVQDIMLEVLVGIQLLVFI